MDVRDVIASRGDEFAALFDRDAVVDVLHDGLTWAEGPAFDRRTETLYFSDVRSNVMYRRTPAGVEEFRRPSGFANGNTVDRFGALVTCEQLARGVSRTAPDGTRTLLVDRFEGRRLNSPNDVVVHSDGSVWFTDPDYGIRDDKEGVAAPSEQSGCHVYRYVTSSDTLTVVADDLVMPNGLAFSPDERILYIADSAYTDGPDLPRHVRAYDVAADGSLSGSRVHVEIDEGWPDGVRVDARGRLWVAAGDGARCYAPDGRHQGTVLLPETAANLCFARIDGRECLVVTATSRVYSVPLSPAGATSVV